MAEIRAWLGAGPVLELGCGNGKTLRPLRAAGVDAVGLDVSWHALRRLGTGILADAARLPFVDAAFTCVLDLHCTGHLAPDGRPVALAEAARALAPGGHLVVERLGAGDLRATQGRAVPGDADARGVADGRTTHFDDEDSLAAAVAGAGLDVVERSVTRRMPRLRGVPTRRESVRAVGRKAR